MDSGDKVLVPRVVDDPSETFAQFIHGVRTGEPGRGNGKQQVTSNEMTRIGALCFFPKQRPRDPHDPKLLQPHQDKAAERFKNEYEAIYGSVGAMNPEGERVDTSPIAHDSGMAGRIDRGKSIRLAERILSKDQFNLILTCIVMGVPSDDLAPILPSGKPNWRHVKQRNAAILVALTRLSLHWGYIARAAA